MFKSGKSGFQITLDPFLALVLVVVALAGFVPRFLLIYCTMLIHELGHILTAKIMGRRIYTLNILSTGLSAGIEEGPEELWKRLLIYISGPFTNMLFVLLIYLCQGDGSLDTLYYVTRTVPLTHLQFFVLINSGLAIFNLIPVLPLDGSRILRDILAGRLGLFRAGTIVKRLSVGLLLLIVILGTVQIINDPSNFSLLAIGAYIFFSLKYEERSVALMNIKNILYRRSRMLKKGIYPARDLIVIKSVRLGEIIKHMDFDRFHFIHVLDEELKCIKVFSEQEVIDGMLKYSTELTFEEWMEKE